jgi:transducin (beta)-like 1
LFLSGHKDEINQIKVNPDGNRLASCSDDGTACIWNIDNLNETDADAIPGLSSSYQALILKGHNHSVTSVGWCVDYPTGSNELLAT